MESIFYTLQDFMTFSKGVTYILMGLVLVCMVGFWLYLSGRDDKPRYY